MVIFGSRGQNAEQSASFAISLGYRETTDCVRSNNAKGGKQGPRWTMMCKWGHPVATLPVTKGTIRHTCRGSRKVCDSLSASLSMADA
eukprot:181094-Pleurochrysis_carterae.AAC.2